MPTAESSRSRGRVVMLVDNTIHGDSRVQKSAASVAAAGWTVVLLGRSPSTATDEFPIGEATARRVPVPFHLEGHWRRNPGRSLRWPLAYPMQEAANRQRIRAAVRRREWQTRRARLLERKAAGTSRARLAAGTTRSVAGRVHLMLSNAVHRLRFREYRRAVRNRTRPGTWIDRFTARTVRLVMGRGAWRRLEPRLLDYENAFAPVIDALQPDVIHAHDYRMSGIALRAARRARADGRRVRAIYDVHEWLPGVGGPHLRWQLGYESYEDDHIRDVDAVVTVSPVTADLLTARYGLSTPPTVVINAPIALRANDSDVPDVRSTLALPETTPLLLYLGVAAEKRGLRTIVEALPTLETAHAVLVTVRNDYVDELEKRAAALGVAERLHVLPYVDPDAIVPFVRTADIGVLPMDAIENYAVTYATKYFEYARARLPVVISDLRAMADLTRQTGNGEVFSGGDPVGLTRAVQTVLSDIDRYRSAYDRPGLLEEWSWETQAQRLVHLYDRLSATPPAHAAKPPTTAEV